MAANIGLARPDIFPEQTNSFIKFNPFDRLVLSVIIFLEIKEGRTSILLMAEHFYLYSSISIAFFPILNNASNMLNPSINVSVFCS